MQCQSLRTVVEKGKWNYHALLHCNTKLSSAHLSFMRNCQIQVCSDLYNRSRIAHTARTPISRAFHSTMRNYAKKFVPEARGESRATTEDSQELKRKNIHKKLSTEEGRRGLRDLLSSNFEATNEVRDEERVRMRGMLWPWLIIFSTTFVATGVVISLWKATYSEKGIDYFWSELISEEQRYKLIEFLSFNSYNWSFLYKERVIETLLHMLDKGSDPEEWYYAIHALFSLIGAVRADTRKLFVEQFTSATNPYKLLLCLKDPLLLKESIRYEGADSCLEELASIIYAVYIKQDNPIGICSDLEALLIEYSEHGNIVHKRIASEFFAKFANQSPLIQEYLKQVNLHETWKSSNRYGYDECILKNLIKAKSSIGELSEEEIPEHFINKKSKVLQVPINLLFGVGELTRSNFFQSTLRSMLYTGFPMMIFWVYHFKRHIGLDFRKSTYLATRCLTRPLLLAFFLNTFRLALQYSEDKFLGKRERSKLTLFTLAILRYLLLYICSLIMVWYTPEFSIIYPFIMYFIPWNVASARITGCGASAIPRKDYSYTDPMFFKAQRRVY